MKLLIKIRSNYFIDTIIFQCLLFALFISVSHSEDNCPDISKLLTGPFQKETNGYINSMLESFIAKDINRKCFSKDIIHKLLTEVSPRCLHPIHRANYYDVAKLIILSDSTELNKIYIRFIVRTKGSADELRSFGLGLLYTENAPYILDEISKLSHEDQDIVIQSLGWGLLNNFFPFLTKENYRRKILGSHWELKDNKYKHRQLIKKIEQEVNSHLNSNNKR